MPITMMHTDRDPSWGAELPANVREITLDCRATDGTIVKTPAYLVTTHVGLVLDVYERNGYDDSDFYAVAWVDDKPVTICYASTRGWTYENSASVDATPDVLAAYAAYRAEQRAAEERRIAERDAATPRKGTTVRVVHGRKLPIGIEAEVIWFGEARQFGSAPRGGYVAAALARTAGMHAMKLGDPREGMRVGLMVDGARVFVDAKNVEVVRKAG